MVLTAFRTVAMLTLLTGFVYSPCATAQIGLPPPPRVVLPPNAGRGGNDPNGKVPSELPENLRKRRDLRKEEELANQPKPPTPSEKQEQALKEEAVKPRPFNFMAAVDFLYPQISTSGDRKEYTTDMTPHHYALFRLGESENGSQSQAGANMWIGYRIAPFSGSGKAAGQVGRYGFTYFGPMIALGKFSPGAKSVGQTEEGSGEEEEHGASDLSRNGIMLGTGLSMLSKNGVTDPGVEEPFDDFASKPVEFDSPGLFVQVQYIHILYGAVGIDYVVGAQLGKEKTFTWAGIGVSGFH